MANVAAAVSDGAPIPAVCFWTQGETNAGALQAGTLTVAQMVASIRAVWAHIRATYPAMQFMANMIGSHDARNLDPGANAARVTYLNAIAATAYATQGIDLYDLQRAEGDIHYHSSAYAIMGTRLARHHANLMHGQSNFLGPRVTGITFHSGNRGVSLAVDWGGPAFVPEVPEIYCDRPFGIYALAPGAGAAAVTVPFISGRIGGANIVLTSSVVLTGHQIGGPWGYAPDARRGHIARYYNSDAHHLIAGQPLRSFLIQL